MPNSRASVAFAAPAPASERFCRRSDRRLRLFEVGDIHLEWEDPPTGILDQRKQFVVDLSVAESERDIRAGQCKRDRDRAAESAPGAGDERDLTGQVE